MATDGWIHKFAFQDNALSADTEGRAAMQDGFVTEAKVADGAIAYAKLANAALLYVGVYDLSFYDMALYG